MNSNPHIFRNVELIRDARVPIIRSIHYQFNIEVDISLHNVLVCILYFYD
jgi:DNA polymerase sigma